MRGRTGGRRGQSILEYVVIITVIVVAILAVRAGVQTHMSTLYNSAQSQVGNAATKLGGLQIQ